MKSLVGSRSQINCFFGRARLQLLGVVAVAFLTAPLSAREYKTNEFNPIARRLARIVKEVVSQPSRYEAEKEQFNQYFQEYYFPVMTQTSTEELGELGERRYNFFRQYMWAVQNPQMQQDLTAMTREYMMKVLADPSYHPSVRYNAILMLGLLDAEYASDSGGTQSKPLSDITKLLVNVVGAAGKSSKITPDLVVGALVGLQRHAQYSASLPPASVDGIETAMLGLMASEDALADLDTNVQAWIKRQAAGVLAQLGRPGQDGRVVEGMLALVEDSDLPTIERCEVAAMFNRLNLEGADTEAISKSLILLAEKVADEQAEEAREYEEIHIGGGFGGGGSRGRGSYRRTSSGFGEELKYERRRLLAQLEYLNTGLNAVASAVQDGDTKNRITEVLAAINSVRVLGKDKDTLDLDLTRQVKHMANDIERVAALYEVPEEPAVESAEAEVPVETAEPDESAEPDEAEAVAE